MKKKLIYLSLFLLFIQSYTIHAENLNIYSDFPGGNIIIDKIEGDSVWLRPDLRDTEGNWFYWYFAVSNAGNRELTFIFTLPSQFSRMGVSVSVDGGKKWDWQGGDAVKTNRFTYSFKNNNEVRFSMGIPYTQQNFEEFIGKYKGNKNLKISTLCKTRKGRYVEMVKIVNPDIIPRMKVLVVARNHACEMMGNYLMEGIIETVMNNKWLTDNVEFLFVPFMDKDGVEDGDQGKNRRPRDHNRDYSEISVHETTAALRKLQPVWSENKQKIALDLHCPWIKDGNNEYIFLVGSENPEMMKKQVLFSDLLEKNRKGELLYFTKNIVKPGDFDWTDPKRYRAGDSFSDWAHKIKGIHLVSTVEFPYSYSSDQVITVRNSIDFGKDLATAIELYLKQLSE